MTHDEQRIYLIRELLNEDPQLADIEIPGDTIGQCTLLRSLMNIRPPRPAGREFLVIQDEYLKTERDMAGIVDSASLPAAGEDSRMILWKGDITTLKADAIVNAANSALLGCFHPMHSCIDNIIHSRSGIQLRLSCDSIMKTQGYEEPAGRAKITPAYNLPCKYVIHTVGPVIYGDVTKRDSALLASCYRSCLELAEEKGCKSIAFCCISTGEFHFPNQKAAGIAVAAVREFLEKGTTIEKVIFNVFKEQDLEIYKNLLIRPALS